MKSKAVLTSLSLRWLLGGPGPGKMYDLAVFSVYPQVSYQLEVQRETSAKRCMLTSNRAKMTDKGLKLTMKGLCLRRSSKFVHKRKRFLKPI